MGKGKERWVLFSIENEGEQMSRLIDLDTIEFLKVDGNKEFNHGVDCCIDTLLKAPTVKAITIPEGATNGDVFTIMLNKTFPKTIVMYKNDESRLTISPIFSREWWETPYQSELSE